MVQKGPKPLATFVSYSSKDQKLANRLAKMLENRLGFRVFLAPRDIKASQKWRTVITEKVKESDALFALLTPNFRKSEWTDQESGMAIALDEVIMPLKTKRVRRAHGFLESYNYFSLKTALDRNCDGILHDIYSHAQLRNKIRWSLVEALNKSKNYNEANERSERLPLYGPFSKKQVAEIFRGFLKNNQIYVPMVAGRNVSTFLIKNRRHISRDLRKSAQRAKGRIRNKTQGFSYDDFLTELGM